MIELITERIDIWTAAQEKKSNGGRGRAKKLNGQNLHGIKKLRELILDLAVQGKLVPQDPIDEPAIKQIKRLRGLQQKLIKSGKAKPTRKHQNLGKAEGYYYIPKTWEWVFLGHIPLWPLKDGDWVESKDQDPLGNVRLIQLADIGDRAYRDKSSKFMKESNAIKLNCSFLEEGDVLIARMPDPLGRACIFPGDEKQCVTVVDVAICRCDNNSFDNNYLIIAQNSLTVRNMVEELATGTTRKRISTGNLGKIQIPVPPLAEQHRIVAKVDELMTLCDRLEKQQTESDETHQTLVKTLLTTLTNAADQREFANAWQRIANHFDTLFTTEQSIDQLKQTILQLAIMGKLVPQDPNDEPASVLLERIKQERTEHAARSNTASNGQPRKRRRSGTP
jgi:type I restriction enzyme S subunit